MHVKIISIFRISETDFCIFPLVEERGFILFENGSFGCVFWNHCTDSGFVIRQVRWILISLFVWHAFSLCQLGIHSFYLDGLSFSYLSIFFFFFFLGFSEKCCLFFFSVASLRGRLQLETGTAAELQILLAREGGSVRELSRRALEARLPPVGTRVWLFDKSFMQPGGVAPMEKLDRFVQLQQQGGGPRAALASLQRQCELQRSQITDQLARQTNRAEACRVAVDFLGQKMEGFKGVVHEFEQKWKKMELHHPALIASAMDDLEKLKTTRVRAELGLRVGRTLWDLYTQNSEPEMILFVRKSQQEHDTLAAKVKVCLEASKNVIRDAKELESRSYELLEPLEQAHSRLMKLIQVTLPFLERKLVQEGESSATVSRGLESALAEYEQLTLEAETFINNYTLSIQLRLQGVTVLTQGVWQQQEQIRGVLGIAVDRLMQRFHSLLIVHELPSLQNLLADEAVRRATFRNRVASTFKALDTALEPLLVDETNRRAGFLADKHPFVREFFLSRFEWVKDEPLSLNLPSYPGFDRKLPAAASDPQAQNQPLLAIGDVQPSQPTPKTPPPTQGKGKEEMDDDLDRSPSSNADTDQAAIAEFVNRIKYLEAQLTRRVERSTSDLQKIRLESKQSESKLLEENAMLKSELSVMEQTLSQYHGGSTGGSSVEKSNASNGNDSISVNSSSNNNNNNDKNNNNNNNNNNNSSNSIGNNNNDGYGSGGNDNNNSKSNNENHVTQVAAIYLFTLF